MGRESREDTALSRQAASALQAPHLTHLGLSASLRASPRHWAPRSCQLWALTLGNDNGEHTV